jgi:copper chaperone CopZ
MKNAFTCFLTLILTTVFSIDTIAQADSLKTAVIRVRNLHCNNDMPTIKKQLQREDGIDEVSYTNISSGMSTFTITYHSSVIDRSQIEKAIESTPGCDDKFKTPYKVKREKASKKSGS